MSESEEKLTFEEAFSRLEAIVTELESPEIGLDESLAKYEEAIKMIQICRNILEKAERRVEVFKKNASGLLELQQTNLDEDLGQEGEEGNPNEAPMG